MPTEGLVLVLACLFVLAEIVLAAAPTTLIYGPKYAAGNRDEQRPPPTTMAARAKRSSANTLETFPIFASAVLLVIVTETLSGLSQAGVWLYLASRIAYSGAYIFGIPVIRSVMWVASMCGIMLVLASPFI